MSCRELELELRSADSCSRENSRSVFLTVGDRVRASSAHVDPSKKKTPVEEENYIMSTWERPRFHPLSLGPRCIRVHGPIPGVTITDMTSAETRRKVMEGTVNRILLRVRAGPGESCRDLKFSVKCSSVMALTEEGPDGPVQKELEDNADPARPPKRVPMLVEQDATMTSHYFTKEGYSLPLSGSPVEEAMTTSDRSKVTCLPLRQTSLQEKRRTSLLTYTDRCLSSPQ